MFVSIKTVRGKAKVVEIAGWMEREEFFKKAKFWKKGDIDPSNNWKVLLDCYNLRADKLKPIAELESILSK